MTTTVRRPQPFLVPEYCKGCGRCVASCAKGCISLGTEIQTLTGLVPIVLDLPIGHGETNLSLPLGRSAVLDGDAGTLTPIA